MTPVSVLLVLGVVGVVGGLLRFWQTQPPTVRALGRSARWTPAQWRLWMIIVSLLLLVIVVGGTLWYGIVS